jgi:hypothetical protein
MPELETVRRHPRPSPLVVQARLVRERTPTRFCQAEGFSLLRGEAVASVVDTIHKYG